MSSDNRTEKEELIPDVPDAKAGGEAGDGSEFASKEVGEVSDELMDNIKNVVNDDESDDRIKDQSDDEDQHDALHSSTKQAVNEDVLEECNRPRQLPCRPAFGLMRSATQMDATKEHELSRLRGVAQDHEVRELSRLRGVVAPDSLDLVDGLSPSSSRSRSLSVLPAIHETLEEHSEEPRQYSSASSSSSGSSMTSSPGSGRRIAPVRRVSSRPTLTSICEEAAKMDDAGKLGQSVSSPGKTSGVNSSSTELVKKGDHSADQVNEKTSSSPACPLSPSGSETGSAATNSVTDLLQAPVPGQDMILRDFVARKIEEVESRLGRRGLVEISDVMEAVNQVYARGGGEWPGEADSAHTESRDDPVTDTVMCHVGEEQVVPLCDVIDGTLTDNKPLAAMAGLNIYINNVVLSCICEVILQLGLQRSKAVAEATSSDDLALCDDTRSLIGRPRGSGSASRVNGSAVNESSPRESQSDHAPSSMSDEKLAAKDNESSGIKSWDKDTGQRRVRERELNKQKPGFKARARERHEGGLKNATGDTHRFTGDIESSERMGQEGRDRKSSCQLEFLAGNTVTADTPDNTSGTDSDPDLARTISNCRFGKRTSTNRQKNTNTPLASLPHDQDETGRLDPNPSKYEERTDVFTHVDPQAGDSVGNTQQSHALRKGTADAVEDQKLNLQGFGDRLKNYPVSLSISRQQNESQNHPGYVANSSPRPLDADGALLETETVSQSVNNPPPELTHQPPDLTNQTRGPTNEQIIDNQSLETKTDSIEANSQPIEDESSGVINQPLDVNNQSLEFDHQPDLGQQPLQVNHQPQGITVQQLEINDSQEVNIPPLDVNTEIPDINKIPAVSTEVNTDLELTGCLDADNRSLEATDESQDVDNEPQDVNDSIDESDWSLEVNHQSFDANIDSQDVDTDMCVTTKQIIQSLNDETEGVELYLEEGSDPPEYSFRFDSNSEGENRKLVDIESIKCNMQPLKEYNESFDVENQPPEVYKASLKAYNESAVSTESLEVTNHPLQENNKSLDVNNQPLKVNKLSEVHNQLLEVFNESLEVKDQPLEVNRQSLYISNQLEVKSKSLELTEQALEVNRESLEVSDQPLEVNSLSLEVKDQQLEVNDESPEVNDKQLEFNNESLEVNNQQLEVNNESLEVNDQQLEVNNETHEVKDQQLEVNTDQVKFNEQQEEVNNESLEVNEQFLEVNNELLAVDDQQLKVNKEPFNEQPLEVKNETIQVNDQPLKFNNETLEMKDRLQEVNSKSLVVNSESIEVSNASLEVNDQQLKDNSESLKVNDQPQEASNKLLDDDDKQTVNELLKDNNKEDFNELLRDDDEQAVNELLEEDNNKQEVNELQKENNEKAIKGLLEEDNNKQTVTELLDDDNKQDVNKLIEDDNKQAANELLEEHNKKQTVNAILEVNNKLGELIDKTLQFGNETLEMSKLVLEQSLEINNESLKNDKSSKINHEQIKDVVVTQKLDDEHCLHNTDVHKIAQQINPEVVQSRLEDGNNFDELCDRAIDAIKAFNVLGAPDSEGNEGVGAGAATTTDIFNETAAPVNDLYVPTENNKCVSNPHKDMTPGLDSNECIEQNNRKTDLDSDSTEETLMANSLTTFENSASTVSLDVDKCAEISDSHDDTANLPVDTVFGQISRVIQRINGESELVTSGIVPDVPDDTRVGLKENEVIVVCQPSQNVLFQSMMQPIENRPPMETLATVAPEVPDVKPPVVKDGDCAAESITVRVHKIQCPKCREHNDAVCKLRIDVSAIVEEVDSLETEVSNHQVCRSCTMNSENESCSSENVSVHNEHEKTQLDSVLKDSQYNTPIIETDVKTHDCGDAAIVKSDVLVDNPCNQLDTVRDVDINNQKATPSFESDVTIDKHDDTSAVENECLGAERDITPVGEKLSVPEKDSSPPTLEKNVKTEMCDAGNNQEPQDNDQVVRDTRRQLAAVETCGDNVNLSDDKTKAGNFLSVTGAKDSNSDMLETKIDGHPLPEGDSWDVIETGDVIIATNEAPCDIHRIESKDDTSAEPNSQLDSTIIEPQTIDNYITCAFDVIMEGNQMPQTTEISPENDATEEGIEGPQTTDNHRTPAHHVTPEEKQIPQATENCMIDACDATLEAKLKPQVAANESYTIESKPDIEEKPLEEIQNLDDELVHSTHVNQTVSIEAKLTSPGDNPCGLEDGNNFDKLCDRAIDAIKALNEADAPDISLAEDGESDAAAAGDSNATESKLLDDHSEHVNNEIHANDDGFSTTDNSTTEELVSGREHSIREDVVSEETPSNDDSSEANLPCTSVVVPSRLKAVTITEDLTSTTIRFDHSYSGMENKLPDMRYLCSTDTDVSPEGRGEQLSPVADLMDQNADSHTRVDLMPAPAERRDYWDDCCPWQTDGEAEGAVAAAFNYKSDTLQSYTGTEPPLIDVMEVTCQQTHDHAAERPLPSGADTAISLHTSRNSLGAVSLHLVSNDDDEDELQATCKDLDSDMTHVTYLVADPAPGGAPTTSRSAMAEWGGARPKQPKFIVAKDPSKKSRYRKRSRSPPKKMKDMSVEEMDLASCVETEDVLDLLALDRPSSRHSSPTTHHTSPSASFVVNNDNKIQSEVLDAKLKCVMEGGSEDEGTRADDEAEEEAITDRAFVSLRPTKSSPMPPLGVMKKRLVDVQDFPPDGPRLYVRGSTSADVPCAPPFAVDPKKVGIWGKFKKALNPTSRKTASSTSAAATSACSLDTKPSHPGGRDTALFKTTRRNSFKSSTLPTHLPARESATVGSLATSKRSSAPKTNKLHLLKGSAETMSGPIPAMRKHRTGSGANIMRNIGINSAASSQSIPGDSHRTSPKKSITNPKSILKHGSAGFDSKDKLSYKSPIRGVTGPSNRSFVRGSINQKIPSRVNIDQKSPPRGSVDQKNPAITNEQRSPPRGNSDQKSPLRVNSHQASPVTGCPDQKSPLRVNVDQKSPARKNNDERSPVRESLDQKLHTPAKNEQKSPPHVNKDQIKSIHTNNDQLSSIHVNNDQKGAVLVNDQKVLNSPSNNDKMTSVCESNDQKSLVSENNEQKGPGREKVDHKMPVRVNDQKLSVRINNEQKKPVRGNNEGKSPIKGCLKNPIHDSPVRKCQPSQRSPHKKGPVRGSPIKKKPGSPGNFYYRKSPKRKSPRKKSLDEEVIPGKVESECERERNSKTPVNQRVKNSTSTTGTVIFSGPGQNAKSSSSSITKNANINMEGDDFKKKIPSFQEEVGQWWAESQSTEIVQKNPNFDKIFCGKITDDEIDVPLRSRSRSRSRSMSPTRPLRPKSLTHGKDSQRRKHIYQQLFETTDPQTYRPPPPKKWMCRVM